MPAQRLVHIYNDPSEIGRVFRPEIAVTGNVAAIIRQLAEAARAPEAIRASPSVAVPPTARISRVHGCAASACA